MAQPVLLSSHAVVPAVWQTGTEPAIFNPAILRHGDGWLCAFRVVGQDGLRRIALCRLTASFAPVTGSSVPWSDLIAFRHPTLSPRARTWFADPRLYCWEGRTFVYWNNGWHEPQNHQFLQEIDPDSLAPVGEPRELNLADGGRQPLEKNWLFFGPRGERLMYSPQPLRIHAAEPSLPGRVGPSLAEHAWEMRAAETSTPLRGGCPPVKVGGHWYAIGHTIAGSEGEYRYQPWVLRFAEQPGFALTGTPVHPLPLKNPFGAARAAPKLNPAVGEVVYPSGADFQDGLWTISYGINDERAAICTLPHEVVLDCLAPVAGN